MKRTLIIVLLLAALLLAGCNASTKTSRNTDLPAPAVVTNRGNDHSNGNGSTQAPNVGFNPEQGTQSALMQLFSGLLSLEGSDLAVTPTQAVSILPSLIQLQGETYEDGTLGQQKQEEMDAYIRSLLNQEQLQAISQMDLSQENMITILAQYNITWNGYQGRRGDGNQSGGPASPLGTPQAPLHDGPLGTPQADLNGTPPGGGQGLGNAQGNPRLQGANVLPPGLLDALIQLFQQRAAS